MAGNGSESSALLGDHKRNAKSRKDEIAKTMGAFAPE